GRKRQPHITRRAERRTRHQCHARFQQQFFGEVDVVVDTSLGHRFFHVRVSVERTVSSNAAEARNFIQGFHHIVVTFFKRFHHWRNASTAAVQGCFRANLRDGGRVRGAL